MMNTIQKTGKWNEISAMLNGNFDLIATQLSRLNDVAWKAKGFFTTFSILENSYPISPNGSYAYVGETAPFTLYTMQNGVWTLTQQNVTLEEAVEKVFDWSMVPNADEATRGLMTSAQVTLLNNIKQMAESNEMSIEQLFNDDYVLDAKISKNFDRTIVTAPLFSSVDNDFEGGFAMASVAVNFKVVFCNKLKCFAAVGYDGIYYRSWTSYGGYSDKDVYGIDKEVGIVPVAGRTYRFGDTLYCWNGSSMIQLYGEVLQSSRPVAITNDEMKLMKENGTWNEFLKSNKLIYIYEEE